MNVFDEIKKMNDDKTWDSKYSRDKEYWLLQTKVDLYWKHYELFVEPLLTFKLGIKS